MTADPTTPPAGATTHARALAQQATCGSASRRGLFGGFVLALAGGSALARGTPADDGPAFLAWEAERERLMSCANAAADEAEGDRLYDLANDVCWRIQTTPCHSRSAALVKLRTVMHPTCGLFSCGESMGDEPALQQVLAYLSAEHRS